MQEMTEREQARQIAERWLEFDMNAFTQMVPGDPDCDACVLARQYLRALERTAHSRAETPDTSEVEQLRDQLAAAPAPGFWTGTGRAGNGSDM